MASRLVRTNPVTVSDVLGGHKLLEIGCAGRVYLTLPVPSLVVGGQVVSFRTGHERNPVPAPALLERPGAGVPPGGGLLRRGQRHPGAEFRGQAGQGPSRGVLAGTRWPGRKIDQVMPLIRKAAATGRSQVAAIGVAPEYQRVFTGTRDQTPTGAVWFSCHRTQRRVSCYCFCLWDAGSGPAFIKVCAGFPYPGKIWVNGHEWAKRPAPCRGCRSPTCPTGSPPAAIQPGCSRSVTGSGPGQIRVFAERWWARLPLPVTRAGRQAGYGGDISMRQVQIATTITFTAPRHARAFPEALAAGNLDIGRPGHMEIIFNRQVRPTTTGVFRTATDRDNGGVVVTAFYRHSRVKTYRKDRRALRPETVINDAHDIGVLRRLEHRGELTAKAGDANRRPPQTMRAGQGRVLASPAIQRAAQPTRTEDGSRAPGASVRPAPGDGPGRCLAPDAVRCPRSYQQEPARRDRPAARHLLQRQPDGLRPAPPAPQRPDPPDRAHPHPRLDPRRPAAGDLLHQALQPPAPAPGGRRPAASSTRTTPGAGRDRSPRRCPHRPSTTQACSLKT
jgi:hypothetical protein